MKSRTAVFILAVLVFVWAPAAAKIAVFENGRILKIEEFKEKEGEVSLYVSGGGKITVRDKYIRRILPDEIKKAPSRDDRDVNSEYESLISEISQKHKVDRSLIEAIITVESGFNPNAVSVDGATGLMQVLPETADLYGISDLKNPRQNIKAGILHLKKLFSRFGENKLRYVLAAYNAGSSAVERYGGVPPYKETEGYVEKIIEIYRGS